MDASILFRKIVEHVGHIVAEVTKFVIFLALDFSKYILNSFSRYLIIAWDRNELLQRLSQPHLHGFSVMVHGFSFLFHGLLLLYVIFLRYIIRLDYLRNSNQFFLFWFWFWLFNRSRRIRWPYTTEDLFLQLGESIFIFVRLWRSSGGVGGLFFFIARFIDEWLEGYLVFDVLLIERVLILLHRILSWL